jgi:hypothetical protein
LATGMLLASSVLAVATIRPRSNSLPPTSPPAPGPRPAPSGRASGA